MALFHFKQAMHQTQEQMQVEKEGNCKLSFRQDIFAKDTIKNNCRNKQRDTMLGGINLGDIMKQTVMEEMKLIRMEDQLHAQRMSGSWWIIWKEVE